MKICGYVQMDVCPPRHPKLPTDAVCNFPDWELSKLHNRFQVRDIFLCTSCKALRTNCRSPLPHVEVCPRTCILPTLNKITRTNSFTPSFTTLCLTIFHMYEIILEENWEVFHKMLQLGHRPSCVTSEVPYLLVSSIFIKKKRNFYVLVFNIFV